MSLLVLVSFAVVALSLVSTSTIVAGGGDCPGAYRNMTMEAACREATAAAGEPMYQTCINTLRHDFRAGSIKEAVQYAYRAAARAVSTFPSTKAWAALLLEKNASLPGEVKAAYELCVRGYTEADAAMETIWRRLGGISARLECGIGLGGEYKAALRGVRECRDSVAKLPPPPSPLLDMVEKDDNLDMVVYLLGKLLGINW